MNIYKHTVRGSDLSVREASQGQMDMQRRRRGGRGRFPLQPKTGQQPAIKRMNPQPMQSSEPIYLDLAEIEALRLVDLEGKYQEEAADMMGFSRGTVWRVLESARRKLVRSIFEGRPLVIGESD
jgi:predicted DNA-binding protein (UPF0251 family)